MSSILNCCNKKKSKNLSRDLNDLLQDARNNIANNENIDINNNINELGNVGDELINISQGISNRNVVMISLILGITYTSGRSLFSWGEQVSTYWKEYSRIIKEIEELDIVSGEEEDIEEEYLNIRRRIPTRSQVALNNFILAWGIMGWSILLGGIYRNS